MYIAIGVALVAAVAAAWALKALLETRKESAATAERLGQEVRVLTEAASARDAELASLRDRLADAQALAEDQAKQLSELRSQADKAKRDQNTSRIFFVKKARDTYEILKQRLAADGFPERIDDVAAGRGSTALSEEAKRLVKDVESWMEQGGSEDSNVLHTLAVIDFARGDTKRAELRLRAASRVSADPLLWENLGDLMRATGRAKRSVEMYKNAAKAAKEDSPVHKKLGLALFAAAEFPTAAKHLSVALLREPDDLDLFLKTARALIEAGDLQRAIDLVHAGAKRFPKSPEVPACAVIAFARMKRFRDAESAFQEAVSIDPKSPDAHVARGFAYLDEAKLAEAQASFRAALESDPARAEAHCGLGLAANRLGALDEAQGHLKKAVGLRPDYAEAWYALKTTYEGLKKFESAVEALNKAVALNPHLVS